MSPPTPKAETKEGPATRDVEPDPSLSSDAAHSTYAEVPPEDPDKIPPDGPSVEQTRGVPSES